jgi:membrane protein involved in colicin uptake
MVLKRAAESRGRAAADRTAPAEARARAATDRARAAHDRDQAARDRLQAQADRAELLHQLSIAETDVLTGGANARAGIGGPQSRDRSCPKGRDAARRGLHRRRRFIQRADAELPAGRRS